VVIINSLKILVKEGEKHVFHIVTICPLYPVKMLVRISLEKGGEGGFLNLIKFS
jgi:hypothetical protein